MDKQTERNFKKWGVSVRLNKCSLIILLIILMLSIFDSFVVIPRELANPLAIVFHVNAYFYAITLLSGIYFSLVTVSKIENEELESDPRIVRFMLVGMAPITIHHYFYTTKKLKDKTSNK
jgi:uncharacterized membrane protein